MEDKAVSARIAIIMDRMGCNQQQFAELLEITQPAISNYLQGRIPPAHVLLKLSKLAQVSVDWILTGEDWFAGHVADSHGGYSISESLVDKIKKLPDDLQDAIASLVDSILSKKQRR